MKRMTLIILATLSLPSAFGSSHREAPGIAQDAVADITDLYAFKPNNENRESHVALIMNVYPGQLASGAPNWYRFGDDVRYEIHIDNDGDAKEDITYRWQFKTTMLEGKGAEAPIAYLPGLQFSNGRYQYNLSQTYNLYKVVNGQAEKLAENIPVAPARVGPTTTDVEDANNPLKVDAETKTNAALADQKYSELASNALANINGYQLFAGPRNDPFYVDLGAIFDGLSVRIPGLTGTPKDALKGINVLSIALEVPRKEILKNSAKTFGVWATTSRQQLNFRRSNGAKVNDGGYVQVSRLGNPLVNEVVIGFKDKDSFNSSHPSEDVGKYADYVLNPRLAGLLRALYNKEDSKNNIAAGAVAPLLETFNLSGRNDLVAAFITGIPGINQVGNAAGTGDMIRVNLDLDSGWPVSGRGLKDDVVKSALTFLTECRYLVDYNNFDLQALKVPGTAQPLLPNHTKAADSINCALDDFVTNDDKTAGGSGITEYFPYVGLPHSSYGVSNQ